jgi:hypothetical protein
LLQTNPTVHLAVLFGRCIGQRHPLLSEVMARRIGPNCTFSATLVSPHLSGRAIRPDSIGREINNAHRQTPSLHWLRSHH